MIIIPKLERSLILHLDLRPWHTLLGKLILLRHHRRWFCWWLDWWDCFPTDGETYRPFTLGPNRAVRSPGPVANITQTKKWTNGCGVWGREKKWVFRLFHLNHHAKWKIQCHHQNRSTNIAQNPWDGDMKPVTAKDFDFSGQMDRRTDTKKGVGDSGPTTSCRKADPTWGILRVDKNITYAYWDAYVQSSITKTTTNGALWWWQWQLP